MKQDIVTLNDEHKQEIILTRVKGNWFWRFLHWPEGDNQEENGPYASRDAAILDATAFCCSA